jgi:hypothetical protein
LGSGVLPNTVYLGYDPASSLVLTANVNGNEPYSYTWSDGNTASSTRVNPVTTTTYLVTVTDANGCHAIAGKDINVMDISGSKNHKVIICHNEDNPSSLEISGNGNAVEAHLAHGDMLGACAAARPVVSATAPSILERSLGQMVIRVMPNPSSHHFSIRLEGGETGSTNQLRVFDIMGRIVEQRVHLRSNQTIQVGDQYQRGIYFVEISNGKEKTVMKLIRQ